MHYQQKNSKINKDALKKDLLDAQINVLLDTESEATGITEVPPQKLVLLNLQTALKKLHSLLSPDRNVASNLLITPDSERSHGVPS